MVRCKIRVKTCHSQENPTPGGVVVMGIASGIRLVG
jgi:hypothetical protein